MSRTCRCPHLRVPHARGIQHHQHRAVGERPRGINQSGDFVDRQDRRQPTRDLRIRNVVEQIAALQRLDEEESERRDVQLHGPRLQLPLAQQIGLIRAQVVLIQLVGRPLEVLGELFNRLDVRIEPWSWRSYAAGVPPASRSEMGHRNLLVTYTLPDRSSVPHA